MRIYNWRNFGMGAEGNMPLLGFCFRYGCGKQCYDLQIFCFGWQIEQRLYTPLEILKRKGWRENDRK